MVTLCIIKTARKMKTMNKVAALNNQIFTRNTADNLWHFLFALEINLQGLNLDETGMTNVYDAKMHF